MRAVIIAALLSIAACGEPPRVVRPNDPSPSSPTEPPPGRLILACNYFAGMTPQFLERRFGAENIASQMFEGEEGVYRATVVFPTDPGRRLRIRWNEESGAISSASVSGPDSRWYALGELAAGDTIQEAERINGRAFEIFGFGWDLGGQVADWNQGAFAPANRCSTHIGFAPRGTLTDDLIGDRRLASGTPSLRAADLVVSDIELRFVAPN